MFIDLAPNGLLELSLFIRAIAYALFFSLLGLLVIRARYPLSGWERSLGWVSLVIGLFNAVMAFEWLYFFFFTDAILV